MSRITRSCKLKLSDLSDEQLNSVLKGVAESSEEDFSSDDDMKDPNYEPDHITPEDEFCISECLRQMEKETTDVVMSNVMDATKNISETEPSASSTLQHGTYEEVEVDVVETVGGEPPEQLMSLPATKRARSPLPVIESSGPITVPSAGGFTGSGKIHFASNCIH